MNKRIICLSLTRITDFAQRALEVAAVERSAWGTGDYVVCRITQPSHVVLVELTNGRMMEPMKGDLVVAALGTRYATLESTGTWEEVGADGRITLLTAAGLAGKLTSKSPLRPPFIEMQYEGHVHIDGKPANMQDYVPDTPIVPYNVPTIFVVGTSMSAGKTSSARVIIHLLKEAGLKVLGAKVTGAGRYKDILAMQDAGADNVYDFVDVGLPSTVHPKQDYVKALNKLLSMMQATGADVAVVEAGASPLEPYNGDVATEKLRDHIKCMVLCASDPYSVVGVTNSFGINPDIVGGIATNTFAGIDLIKKLCGIKALNLTDPDSLPDLRVILTAKLGIRI